jgi:glycosyltransferase involved in cell wall biosynthesis
MDKIPLTVIIPAKNEEANIKECISRLRQIDQVIVVDSQSSDKTAEIAHDYNAEIVQFKWDGRFPKKRNWSLRNLKIKHNWVLFLDADEFVSDEFLNEVSDKIKNSNISGYWIQFQNYFMGKKLKYGDSFKKLPLFKVGAGEYEKIDEDSWSHLDMEVHEHPIISGIIGHIKSPVIHNDYKGLEHYITRHNAYSSWEARRFLALKASGFKHLTQRQKLKYFLLQSGVLPVIYFLGCYFLKLGFLDGKAGYFFAKYKAHYFLQIQTKIRELRRKSE